MSDAAKFRARARKPHEAVQAIPTATWRELLPAHAQLDARALQELWRALVSGQHNKYDELRANIEEALREYDKVRAAKPQTTDDDYGWAHG